MPNSKKSKWQPHTQLSLVHRRKSGDPRGGLRPGAGRPRKPGSISHATRPHLAPRFPQHVTIRLVAGAPSLARDYLMKVIRRAIRDAQKSTFRVVHFNVLSNHLHLITEAAGNVALARGMQGLEVRLARRLNSALMRRGKLFAHRFHARYLETPREVRNCLRYVLLNRKHHDAEKKFNKYWIDPHSSAPWFDGWARPILREYRADEVAPTAPATTWLLTTGWRKHGPLAFDERPS
jgi:REP element-mobilizing transposase RayT